MKPLVYYCRWRGKGLRLRGRDGEAVWGQLVSKDVDQPEEIQEFRFILDSAELIVRDDQGEQRYRLDEKGIPLPPE